MLENARGMCGHAGSQLRPGLALATSPSECPRPQSTARHGMTLNDKTTRPVIQPATPALSRIAASAVAITTIPIAAMTLTRTDSARRRGGSAGTEPWFSSLGATPATIRAKTLTGAPLLELALPSWTRGSIPEPEVGLAPGHSPPRLAHRQVGGDLSMTTTDLDAFAAEVLAAEDTYAPAEWVAVEALADLLVEHARLLRVKPSGCARSERSSSTMRPSTKATTSRSPTSRRPPRSCTSGGFHDVGLSDRRRCSGGSSPSTVAPSTPPPSRGSTSHRLVLAAERSMPVLVDAWHQPTGIDGEDEDDRVEWFSPGGRDRGEGAEGITGVGRPRNSPTLRGETTTSPRAGPGSGTSVRASVTTGARPT